MNEYHEKLMLALNEIEGRDYPVVKRCSYSWLVNYPG